MREKIDMIAKIFLDPLNEDVVEDSPLQTPIQHGKYYGGVYNGRKYMYSESMIETLSIDKLEAVIRKQIGA